MGIKVLTARFCGTAVLGISLVACNDTQYNTAAIDAVSVADAPADLCPNGGTLVQVYVDANQNNQLDPGEAIISSRTVCNGADGMKGANGINGINGSNGINGVDGKSAGILVKQASYDSCPTGGVSVSTFIDANNDGILEDNEAVLSQNTICNGLNGTNGVNGSNGQNGTSSTLTVVAASPEQCSNGGFVYTSTNGNDIPVQSVVCNGLNGLNGIDGTNGSNGVDGTNGINGSNGISTGITLSQASLASCPAGGVNIATFLDSNNSGSLDSGEQLVSQSTICNGIAGQNGSNGLNGHDGASASLTVTVASSQQCPAGGYVYSSSVGNQTPTNTVVCNGVNGTNGTNGVNGTNAQFQMGPVGPSIANKSYSACHHDYLYIPGSNNARGWLVFRHQANGAADQGIGSTGFNVWNVDIADFLLVSEVGNTTYCTLHWDANSKLLTYKVNDNSDHLSGVTGSIQMQ